MDHATTTFPSPADGLEVAAYTWAPAGPPRAVVQIAHGVAEYAERYDRLATALTADGYLVVANDHRGHGDSFGDAVPLGAFGPGGWSALVGDVAELTRRTAEEHLGLPIVLLGHSMGSFAAQQLLLDRSADYAAAVLSGTTAVDVFGRSFAEGGGGDLTALNQGFEPRTGYEWLSRDEAEVDEYVRNPRSGFDLADDVLPQMLSTAERLADPVALAGIRTDLPLLLVSGTDDPLSGQGRLVELVGQRYREAGLVDVTVQLHPEARHEVFNETNRDDVTDDVLAWLRTRVH